jgi:hypothetical protein
VIHNAIHKNMVHDELPETCIASPAFVSARKFGCPANCRARSHSFEFPRPCHSFKKT